MNKTRIALGEPERKETADLLNQSLADLIDLRFQALYAHWNVRGPMFFAMHKLFEEIYQSLDAIVDELAERITTLGGIAEGTVRQAAARSSLKEFDGGNKDEMGFLQDLIGKFGQFANQTREGIEKTDKLGDADTADLLTELSRIVDKDLWLLEAHQK